MSQNFEGFSATIQFLRNLEANNNRDWFQANKQTYQDDYLAPAQAFIETLGSQLKAIFPKINADPRVTGGSMMRIYRDVRFSKDKTPYNTRMRMTFWEGAGKKTENPGFFFGFDQNSGVIYGGQHMFPKPTLIPYRQAVDSEQSAQDLETAMAEIRASRNYEVDGEQYKRVPQGFDPEHPRADLLRYKGIFVKSPTISASVLSSPELVGICLEHCKNMAPLHHWLVKLG
ncbi:MAG: DUF2461 domain-containing protein [Chloroflexi bacterium]|nr:DUF2461 domain-containing protein [Chloroflexota bacterium]